MSTREIATRIADTVRAAGSEVDVRSVDDISDVDRYDVMVFGSGVYDGTCTSNMAHANTSSLALRAGDAFAALADHQH